jgi:hypothetical protein
MRASSAGVGGGVSLVFLGVLAVALAPACGSTAATGGPDADTDVASSAGAGGGHAAGAGGGGAGAGGGTSGAAGARDAGADRVVHADGAVATGTEGSPCWSQEDCNPGPPGATQSGLQCVAPGESLGGGACGRSPTLCLNDAQCAAKTPNSICDPPVCTFPGEDGCRPGCTSDAGCPPGFGCGADHRCAGKPCTPDVVCPVDEVCADNFGCVHKACTRDDQCSGACVKGECYDRPGRCTQTPS